ncbi:hypothetical protein [Haloferax chudinovii]|uniref:Holin n=1 Tax=Haloferax chudinovii TaxID=1109010 RepID=A0ABD5XGW1_9EURY
MSAADRVFNATVFACLLVFNSVQLNILNELNAFDQSAVEGLSLSFWLLAGLVISWGCSGLLSQIVTGLKSAGGKRNGFWFIFGATVIAFAITAYRTAPELYTVLNAIQFGSILGILAGYPALKATPQWDAAVDALNRRVENDEEVI